MSGPIRTELPPDTSIGYEAFRRRVRTAVEQSRTPITVGELAERLIATADVNAYAVIHDALYRDHLQSLDVEGALVFDMDVGLVYSAGTTDDRRADGSPGK
ncbi:hypothetical protein C479_09253 [Halovivax asiaticus JCM 14624]|uniref:Uncharacterized protein n=1 Tax=Halovivax asiaticus JCM 14624 TaxID=1227490 RepID=M0BJB9_9EURY|nr:hypothetical protein C479_09253 [Halovivax asiaticus JCM 14624]